MRLGASETLHGPRLEHNMGEQLRAIIMGRAAEMPRLGVDRQQADSATTSSRTRGETPAERAGEQLCVRARSGAGGRADAPRASESEVGRGNRTGGTHEHERTLPWTEQSIGL